MNDSLLYQAYGVKDYSYASTEYKGNAIYLHLKTNSPKRCLCPHCVGSITLQRYKFLTYSSQSSFWQQAMLFVTPDTTLLLQGLWFGVAVRDTFYPWRGKLHIQVFSLCIGLASDGQYHKRCISTPSCRLEHG